MPQNLFAACRVGTNLIAKRVRLDASVQATVEQMFQAQETAFRQGVVDEVSFDGSWTPNDDEFLTIPAAGEAQIFEATIIANAINVPDLSASGFANENIKALFTGTVVSGSPKVLVQRFTTLQVLERKFALILHNNAFRRLADPAFSLDNSLACIIEGGTIKFKSQQKLGTIIDMTSIYRAATDQEVQTFAGHASLAVDDVGAFTAITNQTSRKLIHAVARSGILDAHTSNAIRTAAKKTGLTISVRRGKIVMPQDHKDIKALLQFLNESRYSGPLSNRPFVTNSHRPA